MPWYYRWEALWPSEILLVLQWKHCAKNFLNGVTKCELNTKNLATQHHRAFLRAVWQYIHCTCSAVCSALLKAFLFWLLFLVINFAQISEGRRLFSLSILCLCWLFLFFFFFLPTLCIFVLAIQDSCLVCTELVLFLHTSK